MLPDGGVWARWSFSIRPPIRMGLCEISCLHDLDGESDSAHESDGSDSDGATERKSRQQTDEDVCKQFALVFGGQ